MANSSCTLRTTQAISAPSIIFLNRDNCEVSREVKIHFIIQVSNPLTLVPFAGDSELY